MVTLTFIESDTGYISIVLAYSHIIGYLILIRLIDDSPNIQGIFVFVSCFLGVFFVFTWRLQHEGNTKETRNKPQTNSSRRRIVSE